MKQNAYCMLVIVLFAGGCEKHNQPKSIDKMRESSSVIVATSGSLIDYKKDKYCFFIGQDKDSVNKIIELQHNYLADDGIINDNGVTHYMNIGEDLIKTDNNDEVLPALFFTTDKNKVKEFSCSIVCSLYENRQASIIACIDSIAPYFSALKEKSSRKQLANELSLVAHDSGFNEEFKIDTVGRKYNFIFIYEKSLKQTNK